MWASAYLNGSLILIQLTTFLIVVVVELLSHVWLFATIQTAACQASLSFTISQSLLKLKSIVSMMSSNPLTLCHPILLLPSIFPNSSVHISSDLIMISCKYFSHCWPWLINGITNSICKKGNRLGYKISEYNTHSKAKNCFLKLLIHFTCNNIKFIAKYGLQKKKCVNITLGVYMPPITTSPQTLPKWKLHKNYSQKWKVILNQV